VWAVDTRRAPLFWFRVQVIEADWLGRMRACLL
jgi:hypothetical protein